MKPTVYAPQLITTRVEWQMTDTIGEYIELSKDCTLYCGPIAYVKGGDTAKAQLAAQNKLVADQMAQQKAIRDGVLQGVAKYMAGSGEGFDPAGLAAMKSNFLNTNTSNFNAAGSAIRSALAARGAAGGDMPVGGDFVRGISSLEGAKASSQSQGLLNVDIQDAQQALNNRFNAASVMAGQSAQIGSNIGTFNQGANDSLRSYITAVNTSPLMDMLGKVGGAAIGGFTGGIANSFATRLLPPAKPA